MSPCPDANASGHETHRPGDRRRRGTDGLNESIVKAPRIITSVISRSGERHMDEINWDDLDEELKKCHPALMKVWNRYRDQMHRRRFETVDVLQELSLRAFKNRDQFRGTTRASFCKWSLVILQRLIVEELRQRRHEYQHFSSDIDPMDPAQQRPSEKFQDDVRYATYQMARENLAEHDRVLIELRFEIRAQREGGRRAVAQRPPSTLADPLRGMVSRGV